MKNKLLIAFFILGIVSIGTIFFYINRSSTFPQDNTAATTTEIAICKEFQIVSGEIGCENAVKIAEEKYDGIVQSIATGSKFRKKSDPNSEGKDIWIISILLNKPVSKNQEIVTRATIFLDRKTGEELKVSYL